MSNTTMTNSPVYTLPDTPINVCILKRPSAFCKTPYVADIMVDNIPHMAHCPALGCCGLSDKSSQVLVVPIPQRNNKSTKTSPKQEPKCTYRVELAVYEERDQSVLVGINPKLAETLMDRLLTLQMCPFLPNVQSYGREKKYLNSRFDFAGIDQHGRPFVMEIKNVPLADYVDVPKKDRKKYQTDHIPFHEKIAYFPDGYRKNSTDVVSPRALKHIQELEIILQNENDAPNPTPNPKQKGGRKNGDRKN